MDLSERKIGRLLWNAGGRDAANEDLRRNDSPVFSRLLLEDHVAVVHPVLRGDVDPRVRVVLGRLPQHVVHDALAVLPHVAQRPPHHVDGVVGLAKEVLGLLQQQGDAGVRDHSQGGPLTHVALEAPRGCVVHPPDAGRAIDLRAGGLAQHLAGAGDDAAELAVQLQRLDGRKRLVSQFFLIYIYIYSNVEGAS